MLLTTALGSALLCPEALGSAALGPTPLRGALLGLTPPLRFPRRLGAALLLGLGLLDRGRRELDRRDRHRVLPLSQAAHAEHHAHQHEGAEQQRDGQLAGHEDSVAGVRDARMRPT